jgi:hypothetical protein
MPKVPGRVDRNREVVELWKVALLFMTIRRGQRGILTNPRKSFLGMADCKELAGQSTQLVWTNDLMTPPGSGMHLTSR